MSEKETIIGLGARGDHVAAVPNIDPERLSLTPEERSVFNCVGRAAQIQEVIARAGFSEPRTIAALLALRAKGAIVPAKVKPRAGGAPVNAAESEEVEIDPARKKEILDLEQGMDEKNHFEVLGLRPGAAPAEVKKAFYDASRRFHPDRYFGKNLGSFRARIDRIFKRLSEAHQVLTAEARRKAYLEEHPELAGPRAAAPPPPEDPARAAERRARMAKHPYLARSARLNELVSRAKGHLAKRDFGTAYTDLQAALRIDEKSAEIKELLAEVRRQHEVTRAQEELKRGIAAEAAGSSEKALASFKAASSLDAHCAEAAFRAALSMASSGQDPKESRMFAQRAVDASPKNAEYRAFLARVLLDSGLKALAKKQFEEVLKLEPDHLEAKKHLKRWWPF